MIVLFAYVGNTLTGALFFGLSNKYEYLCLHVGYILNIHLTFAHSIIMAYCPMNSMPWTGIVHNLS